MSKRGSDQFKRPEIPMRFEDFSFGSIRIDGTTYEHDVVIDRGQIANARKSLPKSFVTNLDTHRSQSKRKYPGMPATCNRHRHWGVASHGRSEARSSAAQDRLGYSAYGLKTLQENFAETNAILHVTC